MDPDNIPPNLTRPSGHILLHAFVQVLPVEPHLGAVHRLVPRLVNRSHDKLPLAGINIPVDGDNIAELEIVLLGKVGSDDTGVALAQEDLTLVRRDEELGIHAEGCFGVDGHPGKELILVDVDTLKPVHVAYRLDALDPCNLIAVGER